MARQDNLCVVYPHADVYSETFIRSHVKRLPARIHQVYGIELGRLPQYVNGGEPLFPRPSLPTRLVHRLRRLTAAEVHANQLGRYLREHDIEAVLAEYGPTGFIMSDVCRAWEIPLVVHFHGYDAYEQPTLQRMAQAYPILFHRASAVIAVSQHMKAQLVNLGAPAERVHCITYGVDTNNFKDARPDAAPPTFLAVGRFVDKKAPYLTLLAFQRVQARLPEAEMVMVGDGPLWETCQRLVSALGLASSVTLLGRCPHEEVALLMRNVRAFVQHSVVAANGDSEGTPVAILEAGASGLPVVATRHTGIQEVVIEGKTGFLVNEGDVAEMARHMLALARDPAMAAHVGAAARAYIAERFDLDVSIGRLWQVIRDVIRRA